MATYKPNMGLQGLRDRNYAPNTVIVPTENSIGNTVNMVDAAIYPKHRIPQPFLNYLNEIRLTEIYLPDGYVGKPYVVTEYFTGSANVTIAAGTLPPGLALLVSGNTLTISGTPTTLGTYVFTLRFKFGLVPVDFVYHINILHLPAGGAAGFVGGG